MKKSGRWAVGLLFLVLIAVIWAGASVLVQYIYEELDYEQPFVLTYICNSLFAIYIPGYLAISLFGCVKNPPLRGHGPREGCGFCCTKEVEVRKLILDSDYDVCEGEESENPPEHPLSAGHQGFWSHLSTAKISAMICPIWFLANWTYNQSLSMTSVTSSTIIATTSSLFTYVLAILSGNEVFTLTKLTGVLLCIAGAIMVALNDREEADDAGGSESSFWGDSVCLVSAVLYSVYTVLIRAQVPNEETVAMPLLFGYIGVFNMIGLVPVLLIVSSFVPQLFSGLSSEVLGFVVLKGLADNVLSDYLWALAVLYTTPTVATVGLSLTIPLAFLSDALLKGKAPTVLSALGAVSVVLGFVSVNVGDRAFEVRCLKLVGFSGTES
uniref:EamA domain-containing protein n=1 Tax=Octactis speculum TaxID=3111310 RepID=A0A7S2GQ05_9STRA|mmetsp:Transcript_54322/g.74219  ORF Transcript_54322/g.74219 Transcript_54322/m.74219 type:complete len:382 (+) Transcript_54322:192-1337(+)